jgi:membrane protein required for beta-lactamase induction
MTFLSILLALLIERFSEAFRPQRTHGWFSGYCDRLSAMSWTRGLLQHPWGSVAALLPLLALVLWLQNLAAAFGGLVEMAFGALVLLYAIGPRDLGDEARNFIDARDSGDEDGASRIAQGLCLSEIDTTEPRRSFAVARAVVILANRRLIGPIFWFVVFGPVGAAGYRAVHLLAERLQREDCPHATQRYSDEVRHVVEWAPSRLTALGYAIAGNFDAVAHAWRNFSYQRGSGPLDEADQLLAHTGLAALDTFPADADELGDDLASTADSLSVPPVVEDAMSLVWRSLAAWIAVIGVGSLIAALA